MSGCTADPAIATAAIVTTSNASDPACHPSGHVNHSRVYQGRPDHARAAANTRGRSVDGAVGTGSARR
jgi:hypothetical protein